MRSIFWSAVSCVSFLSEAQCAESAESRSKAFHVIDSLDTLKSLPRKFFFEGTYDVRLTRTELRVDHFATSDDDGASKKSRNCYIGMRFYQPIGNKMGSSRFDIPLLAAEHPMQNWARPALGDYTLYLAQETQERPSSLQFVAQLRF